MLDGQVDEKVKKERLQVLQDLLFSYQTKFNKNSIGKVMPVLFESKGRHKGQLVGRLICRICMRRRTVLYLTKSLKYVLRTLQPTL